MADVVSAWPDAVGDAIARNAWPARLAPDGTLHVATDSSAWAFELSQLAPTIQERLQDALGPAAPTALRFAPGRLPEPSRDDDAGRAGSPPAVGAAELERGRALASPIEDPELRELVARAAAASLAPRVSDR